MPSVGPPSVLYAHYGFRSGPRRFGTRPFNSVLGHTDTMQKNKLGINDYIKSINGFLAEIKCNRADGRVIFHYGRLLALGLDEFNSAETIFNTLIIINASGDRGDPLTMEEVEEAFESLPDESINTQIKQGLGLL